MLTKSCLLLYFIHAIVFLYLGVFLFLSELNSGAMGRCRLPCHGGPTFSRWYTSTRLPKHLIRRTDRPGYSVEILQGKGPSASRCPINSSLLRRGNTNTNTLWCLLDMPLPEDRVSGFGIGDCEGDGGRSSSEQV
jgi:hypothetical protein